MVPHGLAGQERVNRLNVRGGAIDVHTHFLPPGVTGNNTWTLAGTLSQMEKFGIAVSIMSVQQNGDLFYNGTEKGRAAVRRSNDFGAKLMQDHPTKFGLMGGVPLPDVDGSLKEIAYIFDTLKADALAIHTNDNQGRWPGDAHFEPMWHELNRRRAIVYIHPMAPLCCRALEYGAGPGVLEFDFDVTRAVTSIVFNGVMFRHPDIRFITVHSGGAVPMLAGRIKDRVPPESVKYLPNGLYAELRKWYYDIAHASFPFPMAAMRALMPDSQILFGTDYAPEPMESTVNELPGLKLTKEFEQRLLRGNAERLFPRFKI